MSRIIPSHFPLLLCGHIHISPRQTSDSCIMSSDHDSFIDNYGNERRMRPSFKDRLVIVRVLNIERAADTNGRFICYIILFPEI